MLWIDVFPTGDIEAEPQTAIAYYVKALNDHDEVDGALSAIETAIHLEPDFAAAWRYRGHLLFKRGQTMAAYSSWNRAADLCSCQSEGSNEQERASTAQRTSNQPITAADYFARAADVHLPSEDYYYADSDLEMALTLAPDYFDAYLLRGQILLVMSQYRQALACFEAAIDLSPKSAESYFGLGGAYQSLHEYEKAIAAYTKMISIMPTARVYIERARANADAGNYPAAFADLELATKTDLTLMELETVYTRKVFYREMLG